MTWETALLAVFVFAARLCDVALGTLRHLLVVRGLRALAGCVALAESLVWIFAISRVLNNIAHPTVALAFSLGFATGTADNARQCRDSSARVTGRVASR